MFFILFSCLLVTFFRCSWPQIWWQHQHNHSDDNPATQVSQHIATTMNAVSPVSVHFFKISFIFYLTFFSRYDMMWIYNLGYYIAISYRTGPELVENRDLLNLKLLVSASWVIRSAVLREYYSPLNISFEPIYQHCHWTRTCRAERRPSPASHFLTHSSLDNDISFFLNSHQVAGAPSQHLNK